MKRDGLILLVWMILASGLFSLSWGQCPEDPSDLGVCDTLNVICMDCNQPDTGSYYLIRFPLLVTHDVADTQTDSVAGMQFPLCYTHTNPTQYCSLSGYWNNTSVSTSSRSIFRHLVAGTDTTYNWMLRQKQLGEALPEPENWVWANIILTLDGTSHFWLLLAPTVQPLFGQESRSLMVTMTFKMQDTMHVCIDTCFWPPTNSFSFSRPNGQTWVPRDNLPYCFWVGPPQIRVTSPNGGEVWIVGGTHDITWISENFSGANVKIDYSTNSGVNWLPVIASTPNTGSYPWQIPATTSPNCRVKVSDLDGDPYDVSDNNFSIIQTPFFTMDVVPDTQWVKQGDTTSYEVILTSVYGFSSPCTLTVSGLPPFATYELNPPVVTPTDTSTLTIAVDSLTPLGAYVLTIIGREKSKLVADTVQALLYVLSSVNRKPQVSAPGPLTTYGGLQLTFAVIATDADTIDTLTLTKSGVGDFPCYPRVSPVVCYFQWTTQPADTLNSPYTVTFAVEDGRDSTDTGVVQITVLPYHVSRSKRPGDLNGDSVVSIGDVVFLIDYLYQNGPPPNPPAAGDINGDCFVGLSDLIWLINFQFRGGPPPQIRCLPGDFNYDGAVNMLDPPYFIDYMAFGGPPPVSMKSTDVNADCFINPVDLVCEIKYLLRGGEALQPGCVEPKVGVSKAEPPGVAEVGFSKSKYELVSRTIQMPVYARFDKEAAGAELVVTFDPDLVSLLPPTLTPRTEGLGLYYNLQRGKLVIGLLDINGVNVIQPGDGPILNLNFVPEDPKRFNLNSIQIEKATFVDMKAQEFLEKVAK
jgi:hypothetical protein